MSEKTPSTVTIRRNPPRRARPTPSSTLPLPLSTTPHKLPSFPLQDILNIQIPQKPEPPSIIPTNQNPPENLKVFLRIRPLTIPSVKDRNGGVNFQSKNVWPKNPKVKNVSKPKGRKNGNLCVSVNDACSITISPPGDLQDAKRVKSEVYEGFSQVFASESTQVEVYEKLLKPLVGDFLKGKSGMLAAVGPSGSGKTHTMFGCVREPGMVPLALGEIFSSYENKSEKEPRTIYMSMFEISSEKGKSERISDLLQGGGHDLVMQSSNVKGVQQVKIDSANQAEGLLACGLLKRATAGTNTNSQSSRSQCIINFRQATCEVDDQADYSELTIVDLAGAEREKRTGNQGTRLLESNFINNTSMVFGLCLRALLEHQKNPKRPLQKHFQNSMLTRYLRDYLEGKKRMSLILTVKPSEEDYLDTSFVLRQAAPYMQIKFSNVEQPNNLTYKRPLQTLNRTEPLKRRKHTGTGASEVKDEKILGDPQIIEEGHAVGGVDDANLIDTLITEESLLTFTEADKNYKVLQGLSKAIWKLLKEYNTMLKETQKENCILNDELAKERKRCSDLESLIQDVKFKCSCQKEASESNMNANENLQTPSSVSCIREGSDQNSIEHARDSFERSPSACVPSRVMVEISKRCSPQQDGTSSKNVNYRPNNEASERPTDSCLQSCEGLDKPTESYSSGENINHSIDKLNAVVCCSDDEACISSVSEVLPLTNFNDSGDSEHLINVTDVRTEYIHHNDQNLKPEDTTDLEIEELSDSAAPLSDSNTKNLYSPDQHLTCSSNLESVVSSSQFPNSTTDRSLVTKDKQLEKVSEIHEKTCSQECDDNTVSMVAAGVSSPAKDSQNLSKPKRRLLPVSSLLLKDMSSLTIEDETDKRKGARVDKKVSFDEKNKTQSKTSLLQLLHRNVVR